MLLHVIGNQAKEAANTRSIQQSGMKHTGVFQQCAVHGWTVVCISSKQGKRYSMLSTV